MSFLSVKFAIFLIVLLGLLIIFKDNEKQNVVLLIASYIFYSFVDYKFLLLLVVISFLSWFLGKKISNNIGARWYLLVGVMINATVLCAFKYYNFFAGSFCRLIGKDYVAINIIIPIGISFYIFQSISYIVDVYNKKTDAEESLINVLLYIGFFPQIVSGPIVKSHMFMPQIHTIRSINMQAVCEGFQRFLLGIFKKKVVADRL